LASATKKDNNVTGPNHHKFHIGDFKTVVVGVDLSSESKDLVKESVHLASKWNAKLEHQDETKVKN
jgi:hypothetical protein